MKHLAFVWVAFLLLNASEWNILLLIFVTEVLVTWRLFCAGDCGVAPADCLQDERGPESTFTRVVGHVCVVEVAGIRSQGAKQAKENMRDVCGELRRHSDFRLSISMTPLCLRMNI